MNINPVLIEKITHSEEEIRKKSMNITIGLAFSNFIALSVVIFSYFTFEDLNAIFLLSALTSIIISVITVKSADLTDNIGKMHNKIIVECVTNNELSKNNEN